MRKSFFKNLEPKLKTKKSPHTYCNITHFLKSVIFEKNIIRALIYTRSVILEKIRKGE